MNKDSIMPAPASRGREDGSIRIRGRNILDLRMDSNDLQAATVREYLCEMLKIAFVSGTHPELAATLIKAGVIPGSADDDGTGYDGMHYDPQAVTDLTWEAIEVLSAEPFRPIGTKTSTERRSAQLQRRNSGTRR